MKKNSFFRSTVFALALVPMAGQVFSQTPLADQPVFTIVPVPGNMALAVSVEFPTVLSTAHPTINLTGTDPNYASTTEYLGYFDPNKCYQYQYSATEADRHFYPVGLATNRTCSSAWSGNFLNWVTTSTIDTFRWALTGGYRKVDSAQSGSTPGVTWLEKSWSSSVGDANTARHPLRLLANSTAVTASTPLGSASALFRVNALGNKMWVSVNDGLTANPTTTTPPAYTGGTITNANAVYELSVRVKVCDAAIGSLGLGGLEANCIRYGSASPYTYKPEGLMQQYAEKIRYSVFGYLNDSSVNRDGGVLRARQAFIGLKQPVPLSTSVANPVNEWDPATGQIYPNPRSADANQTVTDFTSVTSPVTPIVNSGALNYVNKFGEINPTLTYGYKGHDPVGELYYAATRYLKGLPNVPSWTEMASASSAQKNQFLDGFPVIRDWTWPIVTPAPPTSAAPTPSDVRDPILYSCQKNFILGIGDVNTHADKNVPGKSAASGTANEPTYPTADLSLDPVQSATRTNDIGALEGLGNIGDLTCLPWCNSSNSYLMTGIAYDSNTSDIRPDNANMQTIGKQTIQTYWVDVLEYSKYQKNNQFYLAAKYGGFKVPTNYAVPTALALDSWYNTTRMSPVPDGGGATQKMPDNYFVSSRADQLVAGLSSAFGKINAAITATTTASATALPQVSKIGDISYSANYDSKTWSSQVEAMKFNLTTSVNTPLWSFSSKLAAQLASNGWKPGGRIMATWDGSQGIPFEYTNLTPTQKTALDTPWIPGDDSASFLDYLRGDRTNETTSPGYRNRPAISSTNANPNFVGDIVGSRLNVVGPPSGVLLLEEGYKGFRDGWGSVSSTLSTGRPTIVYVGTNGGVLHAIVGAPFDTAQPTPPAGEMIPEVNAKAGQELFAYVPSALFQGTSSPSTSSTRADNGLAALGNPAYVHRNFVNSTPMKFDIDMAKTVAGKANNASCLIASGNYNPNWRTMLIGGLGKGGRSYYALDVTDPAAITSEAALAAQVKWEFPRVSDPKDANLADKVGYSYGEPVVVRTDQYGWVVILTSGYNSVDGKSYFFLVDPCTGYLVQPPIATKTGIASVGMAHATAYVTTIGSARADAAYAGDLLGNVWRLDLTDSSASFPEAELIATLTDSNIPAPISSTAVERQPITTRPIIEYDPDTLDRFVMVGTGRLLEKSDTSNPQKQTFYAFRDGNVNKFSSTLKTATSLIRADFKDISNSLTTGATFSTQKGWFVDLGTIGDGSGLSWPGTGWRMIDNPKAVPTTGRLLFVAILPDSSDPCTSGAESVLYAVDFGKGKSLLGGAIGSVHIKDRVVDPQFFNDGSGTTSIKYGNETTGKVDYLYPPPPPSPTWRQLNWREIPVSQ